VLTLEDWEIVMYSVARGTNDWSVLFFVSWAVLGKYILLTLFLAVTLEAFESKYDTDSSVQAYFAYKSTPTSLFLCSNDWTAQRTKRKPLIDPRRGLLKTKGTRSWSIRDKSGT